MKRRPSSQLWKQIFGIGSLWVVAQRRKTEGCVQIVGETECRILQGERERERVEDLNIFLGFLFTGIHSSELKMLTIDDILYTM